MEMTTEGTGARLGIVHYKLGTPLLACILLVIAVLGALFFDAVIELLALWGKKEEYSHAYLLPVLAVFLIWQKKNYIQAVPWRGAWEGVVITLFGILVYFIGTLSTIFAVVHYALVFVIAGLVISLTGTRNVRYVWAGLILLFFMVPFPQFIYQALSTRLQLISSELGVAIIRAFGVSVFLEGNVIDLGSFKLQVVEACNGLRYLFPLASFGFVCAYLYRGPIWQKLVIFLSTIPITVFMNSLRIGVIGFTVDRWGQAMAEGFLHDFEGWAIFMACLGVLFLEIAILSKLQRPPQSFADTFFVEIPASIRQSAGVQTINAQFIASFLLVCIATVAALTLGKRQEVAPERASFDSFPMVIGSWKGESEPMEQVYIDALKFSDYVMANYKTPDSPYPVNFYVAYYESQKAGESAHSPRACIPGGGWKIEGFDIAKLSDLPAPGQQLPVNRVQIALGDSKQLVYYWFQQRGRAVTHEYLVKWFLLWDALTMNRTDGALVRVTTYIPPGEDWSTGDERLQSFLRSIGTQLDHYVPD